MTRSTASRLSRQYSCARSSCLTISRSLSSSILTSTIGRSPEMPCGHRADWPNAVFLENVAGRAQRGIGVQHPVGNALKLLRLFEIDRPDSAAAPVPGSMPGSSRGRRPPCRDACRPAREPAARLAPTPVQKAMRAVSPGAIRTRRRSASTGSSTVPVVLDSGRASTIETALRKSCPRPRKRARSVSNCKPPMPSPSSALTWATQSCGIRRDRGPRRVASSAPLSAMNSVLHEQLGERGVRGVGVGRRQHHLGVGRQFDFADAASLVGHRDPAHLRVVFGRHEDLGRGEDGSVPAGDFRAILEKRHVVAVGLASDRLISGRPYLAVRPRRAGTRSNPRDRRSDPRASGSRRCRANGCIRSRPRST